jgi:hypothetical protein
LLHIGRRAEYSVIRTRTLRPLAEHERGSLLAAFVLCFGLGQALGVAGPAIALVSQEGPVVEGSVQGSLAEGSSAIVRISASAPGGPDRIRRLGIDLVLRDVALERLVFEPDQGAVGLADGIAVSLGSPGIVGGSFLRFTGSAASVEEDRLGLTLTIRARVVAEPPFGSAFRFTVLDDDLARAESLLPTRVIQPSGQREPDGGLTWGTLGLAVAAALFAGGFIGNLFASGRRSGLVRPSIYDVLRARLSTESGSGQEPPPT